MFPIPKPELLPNTYAYESGPMVKATGFREYDARWLFGKEINLMGVQALCHHGGVIGSISKPRNQTMSCLTALALMAAMALGGVSMATEASARGGGGHVGHGVSHSGGHRVGGHFGGFRGSFGLGFYQPYYEVYPYAACWSWSHVLTNNGWRWRRVDVCNHYPQYFYY
jgi:hypothetical protein